MFKKQLCMLSVLLFSFILLTGCTTVSTPKADGGTVAAETVGNAESQGTAEDDLEASLEEAVLTLSTSVSDTLSKINNLSEPEGTDEDKRAQYLELEQELSDLDMRIDDLDDTLENKFRASQISTETYEKLHRELESFEDLVDSAEDRLEMLFGIND